ncbi:MAG: hypothetical protein HUK14_04920 [Muribaculaceae bacterium]|nr:hypothetical protein [Muribaculaceae bacterium]
MKYRTTIQLMTDRVPQIVQDFMAEALPVDLTVKSVRLCGIRVLNVNIEADTIEDLEAKRKAFKAMMEAKGYGYKER